LLLILLDDCRIKDSKSISWDSNQVLFKQIPDTLKLKWCVQFCA
jgi:hypothetical protein